MRKLTDEAGYPPSIREIAETVALSASTVVYHLQALERRGIVTHTPHRSRSYQLRR
ncbi:LexA family transcriptional regulator [Streptomyces sp. WAC01526]|uniref:LexA family protein n=1 Tax=Streptomyces sp. WAC01526 TaxID=2588709 RepID=UPI001652AD3F|nr:winged helix-turn-helix transcriptional regulator [Streptomyces sp. WAC01526]